MSFMNITNIFEAFTWMFSGSLEAREVNRLVGVSSDENPTRYLLSKVQIDKKLCENKNILYATTAETIPGTEPPQIYNYPDTVHNNFHISGVDEYETHLVIYDRRGTCVSSLYGKEVDVTHLKRGMYVLCINEYFVKFFKV
jgi:hypothetical protein